MAQITRKPDYSDLDLDFIAHPVTKDVMIKTGDDAIKRSVRNLILTNYYDRPFNHSIGSGVQKLLFENINPLTLGFLKDAIINVISIHETRVSLNDVQIDEDLDRNGFTVTISFTVQNKLEPVITSFFLERLR